MNDSRYDIAVVGGGPAGYVAAIKASQLGARVVMVEKDAYGGTCLNRGCIPSKAYLDTAELLHAIGSAAKRGIVLPAGKPAVDMPTVVAGKDRIVRRLSLGVKSLLQGHGVDLVPGAAKLVEGPTVLIDGQKRFDARKIILAAGSRPSRPPIEGVDLPGIVTSDEIFDLRRVPENMIVLGGGVIGVEMARIFRAFGSRVTIVEMLDRLATFLDEEISAALTKSLKAQGIQVLTGMRVDRIRREGETDYRLDLAGGAAPIQGDCVLLAVGRQPAVEAATDLNLARENGRIRVSAAMETSLPGLYAPGDVNGGCMLAHAAFKMGETAAVCATGGSARFEPGKVPGCIYGQPEVGYLGLTESRARQFHGPVRVGRFPFAANGRAVASGHGEGLVKVIAEPKFGEIVGVHIFGPLASELINEASALVAAEVTVEELAEAIHNHPSYSETLMEAAADALGSCIHLPPRSQ